MRRHINQTRYGEASIIRSSDVTAVDSRGREIDDSDFQAPEIVVSP